MNISSIDSAGDHHITIVFDDLKKVVFATKACERLFNCPIKELQNRYIDILFDVIQKKRVWDDIWQGRQEGAKMELSLNNRPLKALFTKMHGPDGRIWMLLNIEIKDPDHPCPLPTGASRRSVLHENLWENTLDYVLDAAFDGIVIYDAESKVLMANTAFEELSGIKKDEIVGRNISDLIKAGAVKKEVVFMATQTCIPTTMMHIYSRTGKSAMTTTSPVLDDSGNIIYFVANVRDISQLMKINESLDCSKSPESEEAKIFLKAKLAELSDYKLFLRNINMKKCVDQAIQVAKFDTNVLIMGESGVGKTKLAELIHKASKRSDMPFVSINCGSIPENLLESELFGYEKGAFTDAKTCGKVGQFEIASGGTFVLDEIGELSLKLQAKLLKAIDEKKILKLGGTATLDIDVRIIAITNRNLPSMVEKGEFRKDLYFRLSIIPIMVPPLRERVEEIPFLIDYFFNQFNAKYGIQKRPSLDLIKTLCRYDYPGNVRELKNIIERLIVMCPSDLITASQFDSFRQLNINMIVQECFEKNIMLQEFLEVCEKKFIQTKLTEETTLDKAAKCLGISSPTLWRKLKKYGLRRKLIID